MKVEKTVTFDSALTGREATTEIEVSYGGPYDLYDLSIRGHKFHLEDQEMAALLNAIMQLDEKMAPKKSKID